MIISRPQIEPIYASMWQRPQFRVTKTWCFSLNDGLQIVIPSGFVTDLASIPRLFWNIPGFSPTGPLLCGSIAHDFGYQYGYLLSPFDRTRTYPEYSMYLREHFTEIFTTGNIPVYAGRPQSTFDSLLRLMTIEATGARFVANAAYVALSLFGRFAWNNYRSKGPCAYNTNSLGLPGITKSGVMF